MGVRKWAWGLVFLTLVSTTACDKSETPGASSDQTATSVSLIDLTEYRSDVLACFDANEEQFRDECKRLANRIPHKEGEELPIRTGSVLLAGAPEDWRSADPEPPEWELALLNPKTEDKAQTIGFVYHTKSSQGKFGAVGEDGSNSGNSVGVFTRDALIFLVDRRSQTPLGSILLRGPVPSEVPANRTKVIGEKPDLSVLENCAIIKLEETATRLDSLVEALRNQDLDGLKEFAFDGALKVEKLWLQWARFRLLAGSEAKLEVTYEGLSSEEQGLEALYSLATNEGDAFPELVFHFREEKLTDVELTLESSQERALAALLVEDQGGTHETSLSLAQLGTQVLSKKETPLAEKLLSHAELKAESKEDRAAINSLKTAIAKKKRERHSGRVEALNDDALGFLATKDFESALSRLKKAQELNPDNDEVLFLLLRTYDGLKEFKKARLYAERLHKEHPNGKYSRRVQEFQERLKDREHRQELGGDPTARYQITEKPVRTLATYGSFYPTPQTELDAELAITIHQGYSSSGASFERLSLQAGTKAKVEKTAYYKQEPTRRRRSRSYRSSRHHYQMEVDAAYISIVSGEHKGRKGWIKLELVEYNDVGIASEPFALPLINPNDAYGR